MTPLDQFSEGRRMAHNAIAEIVDVARALRRVGSPLASELAESIETLEEAHKMMAKAVHEDLAEQVKTSHGHIAEVLRAMIKQPVQEQQS